MGDREVSSKRFTRWTVLRIAWYVLVGAICETLGMHRLAAATYRRGIRFSDRQSSHRFANFFKSCVARTYDTRGDKDQALQILKERVAANPEDAMAYFDLAEFYFFNHQKDLAIQNYERALQLETDEEWRRMIKAELSRLRASTPAS